MCFVTYQRVPKIARKDIVVYKGLLELNGELLSPYYSYYKWKLNKVRWIKHIKINGIIMINGLYAFSANDESIVEFKKDFMHGYNNLKFFEAVIPKRSEYVISSSGKLIASNKLKVIKEIECV